jgi:hypothetical protein
MRIANQLPPGVEDMGLNFLPPRTEYVEPARRSAVLLQCGSPAQVSLEALRARAEARKVVANPPNQPQHARLNH